MRERMKETRTREAWGTWICFGILMIITIVLAGAITDIWHLPSVLTTGGGDGMLGEALIKSIMEDGLSGNLDITRLGAPETSAVVDTPFLDWIYVVIVWFLSFFMDNPGRIMVFFYVITYVTASASMFFLLRKMGCRNENSVLFSLLFSFSTFHIIRNMGHMTLSNYFMVPFAVYLAFYMAGNGIDDIVSLPFRKKGWKNTVVLGVMAFLLGFANIYFVAFGLIFMATAFVYRLLRTGHVRESMKYLAVPALTGAGVVMALLPKIIYGIRFGENPYGAMRNFAEAELYGMKIIQLLIPPFYSRLWGAADMAEEYSSNAPLVSENSMSSMGIIGVIGFFGLCAYFLYSHASKKRNKRYDFSALCVLTAVLVATVGGFGVIFNFFVTPEIRCYCRISIYIICFCYMAFAVKLSEMKINVYVRGIIMAVIVVLAWYDQFPQMTEGTWEVYGAKAGVYEQFYSEVEGRLEKGAMVYQLPFVEFPEAGAAVGEMDSYTPLSAYVFTSHLRWSHGGIKGRNDVAKSLYISEGTGDAFVQGIKNAGFCGVCINITGYAAEKRNEVIGFYTNQLGITPVISGDGQLYFYEFPE